MKKIILILLLSMPVIAFAQNAAPKLLTPPKVEKPTYQKIAVLTLKETDVQNYFNLLNEFKRLLLYEPGTTPEQKVEAYKNIDKFINEMGKRVQVDSVKIEPKR